MVAGDHDRSHASGARRLDRHCGFGARRVDHADDAEKHHLLFVLLAQTVLERRVRQQTVSDAERAQRVGCQGFDRLDPFGAPLFRQQTGFVADLFVRATTEQHVGRALGGDADEILVHRIAMGGAHHLAFGGKRHLADADEALVEVTLGDSGLTRGDDQRALGRVALDRPALARLDQAGVVGKFCRIEQAFDRSLQRPMRQRCAVVRQLAFRRVADARDVDRAVRHNDTAHGHLVARQRPGLVRADDRRRAERLHRTQAADDHVAFGHP